MDFFKNNYNIFFFICHPLQVIFVHDKSKIETAIRDL